MLSLVIGRGEPIWTSDYAAETSFAHESFDGMVAAEQFRALLAVPLAIGDRVVGALFTCKRAERHFDDDEIGLLAALASHAAIAIDNATTLKQYRETAQQLNAANRQLERTLAWDRQLTNVVLAGGGVEDLLTEIAAAATGQLILLNADADLPADVAGRCPDLMGMLEAVQAQPALGGRVVAAGDGSVQLAPIVADREVLGALVLIDGDDHDSDQLLLERAAPVMALAITGERAITEATRLTRDAMVIDLLTRPATGPAALRQRMRNAGLDPVAAYCITAAQAIDELPRRRSSDIAAGLPAGTIVAADGTRLVAVVPAKHPDAAIRHWSARSGAAATAGVAGPTASPADLHRCYREAIDTMDALLTLGRTGTVVTAGHLSGSLSLKSHSGSSDRVVPQRVCMPP